MSKTIEVSAPIYLKVFNSPNNLHNEDWVSFEQWVAEIRNMGVNSVVVPILWGIIESKGHVGSNEVLEHDWSYYDKILDILFNNKIKCTPEFVFHQTKDSKISFSQQLPDWIWGDLLHENKHLNTIDDLKFINASNEKSSEYLSIWIDEYTFPYYKEVLESFKKKYADFSYMINKVIISTGPKGELRYPAFDNYDWDIYKGSGTLQCFSEPAKKSFIKYCQEKYLEVEILNQHWKEKFRSFSDIKFPNFEEDILKDKKYITNAFGIDFFEWYNKSLTTHGRELLELTDSVFNDCGFESVKIAFRIAGIYWMISDTDSPRLAEIMSGIIKPSKNISSLNSNEYYDSISLIIPEKLRERVVIHYTGAEKINAMEHKYSNPSDLSSWVRNASHDLNIKCIAENASKKTLYTHEAWNQLEKNLFENSGFDGVNIISLRDIMNDNDLGLNRLKKILGNVNNNSEKQQQNKKHFRVMSPLHLKALNKKGLLEKEDLMAFDSHLKAIKNMGITAVSVDVWWGLVMRENEKKFDWSYYRQIVDLLKINGLNWVPILSFHQAGGNVNDDFSQMLPLWVWGKILSTHKGINSIRDLQYISETEDASMEYISLWADDFIIPLYEIFMEGFKKEFQDTVWMTEEINISMGTAGELRYPSFNSHDWGEFPNRGTLQCYSSLAKNDFIDSMQKKYTNIDALNDTWNTKYNSFDEVSPPKNPSYFFENNDYFNTKYGRDFIFWYNDALLKHGKRILNLSFKVFSNDEFENVDIGFKIPGIHWNISNPQLPRVSEITAGLISSHSKLSKYNDNEYSEMLNRIVKDEWKNRLVIHFTCLEMKNDNNQGYSRAEDLVAWMAEAAFDNKIRIMGENALATGIYNNEGWDQINKAMSLKNPYNGLTILRMGNLTTDNEYGVYRLKELTSRFG